MNHELDGSQGPTCPFEPSERADSPAPGARAPTRVAAARAAQARLGPLEALFDDPSPTVWRAVRRELGECGKSSFPALRRLTRSGSPRARTRARRLLLEQGRARAARRLCGLALRGEHDHGTGALLETGLFLLARFASPGLDGRAYMAALDAMGAELLRRTERLPPTIERALHMVRYLGQELGFAGEAGDYHHPDNVHLHRALERRRGLPLTLAAIYQAVARRAGIHARLVGLPGHVLLRLSGSDRRVLVDPFRGGIELSERDCLAYLANHGLTFQQRWFQDASDLDMLERQMCNLAVSYRQRGLEHEVKLLGRVLHALRGGREQLQEVGR